MTTAQSNSRILTISISLILVGFGVWGWEQLNNPQHFPIRHVTVWATYAHISPQSLRQLIEPEASKGLFGASLRRINQQLKAALPWVDSVALSRSWPSTLEIILSEKQAVAGWHKGWLFSKQGVLFNDNSASPDATLAALPQLDSTPEQADNLFQVFQTIDALLAQQPITLKTLSIDTFNELTIETRQGFTIHVGSGGSHLERSMASLKRFLKAYPALIKQHPTSTLKQVDLRYPNGFSVELASH